MKNLRLVSLLFRGHDVQYNYKIGFEIILFRRGVFIGKNIARLRKEKGLTQAELGDILGVSNQAVSKWESEMSLPDVMLLPALADAFDCYIDQLFSREIKTEIHYDHCAEFPWNDDDVIRGVICKGKKILQVTDSPVDKISFEILGDSLSVSSELNIIINGNVVGGCVSRGGSISANGSITGECTALGDIKAGEWIMGECTARGNIHAGTTITGGCTADHITATSIFGDACGEFHEKCEGLSAQTRSCNFILRSQSEKESIRTPFWLL